MTIKEYLKQWEGYTADEVANILRWKGIKGTPRSASWCPINRDIKRDTGRLDTQFHVSFLFERGMRMNNIPIGLRHFANRFDEGDFPDLVISSRPT